MQTSQNHPLDLDAYLARMGYGGGLAPTLETLKALHLAHATHIPFENLDVLLGRPIRLDLASLQKKLVHGRRGGYCFEQNTLLAAVLERLGFRVNRLAARVRWGTDRLLPRTHMLLQVEAAGARWLADVGFGSWGLLEPIPLTAAEPARQFAWTYRLGREADLWVLQTLHEGAWKDLYAFTLEPQHHVDFEVMSHYTSTHADSRFTQTLIVGRPTPQIRYLLRDRELTIASTDGDRKETVEGDEQLLAALADHFGLAFPTGTRFLPS